MSAPQKGGGKHKVPQPPPYPPPASAVDRMRMPPAYPPGHISSPASSSTGPYPSAFAKAAMKAKSKPQSRQGPPKQGDYWRDEERAPSDPMMHLRDLGSDPAPLAKKLRKYPSDFFLETADGYLVARYCMFLLQALMLLVRVFRIPNELKEKYGERGMTAALYALFFATPRTWTTQQLIVRCI